VVPTAIREEFSVEEMVVRKLIFSAFVTVDGVMEAPSPEPDRAWSGWVGAYQSPEQFAYKFNEVEEAEILLLGRVTYQTFSDAWPSRSGPFADKMNAMPKLVASRTMDKLQWNNSQVIGGDLTSQIASLKQDDGGPILVAGSRLLSHALAAANLIDEYRLMVMPVVIGIGSRLFPESGHKMALELVETQAFPIGVTLLTYRRAAA
jgi:dihydrofolate reductase